MIGTESISSPKWLELLARELGASDVSVETYYREGPHYAPDGETTAYPYKITMRLSNGRRVGFITPVEWERVEVRRASWSWLAALLAPVRHHYRVKDVREYVENMMRECVKVFGT